MLGDGQRVLDLLQPAERPGELRRRRLVAHEQAERGEGLHAEQRVVVGLVGADLRVQAAEAAGHPGRVAALVVVRQQVAPPVAQVARELGVVGLDGVGGAEEAALRLDHARRPRRPSRARRRARAGRACGRARVSRCAQSGLQRAHHRMALERGEVGEQVLPGGAAHGGPLGEQLLPVLRMRGEQGLDLGGLDPPGIDVPARSLGVDVEEGLAPVVEGGGDRPLEEPIEGGGVARETRRGGERLGMTGALVDSLQDRAHREQFADRLPLAGREAGQVGGEADDERLVENLLLLLRGPGSEGGVSTGQTERQREQQGSSSAGTDGVHARTLADAGAHSDAEEATDSRARNAVVDVAKSPWIEGRAREAEASIGRGDARRRRPWRAPALGSGAADVADSRRPRVCGQCIAGPANRVSAVRWASARTPVTSALSSISNFGEWFAAAVAIRSAGVTPSMK